MIEAITEIQPRAVIVDSIQTVYLAEANGSAGSVSQVGHQLLLEGDDPLMILDLYLHLTPLLTVSGEGKSKSISTFVLAEKHLTQSEFHSRLKDWI